MATSAAASAPQARQSSSGLRDDGSPSEEGSDDVVIFFLCLQNEIAYFPYRAMSPRFAGDDMRDSFDQVMRVMDGEGQLHGLHNLDVREIVAHVGNLLRAIARLAAKLGECIDLV